MTYGVIQRRPEPAQIVPRATIPLSPPERIMRDACQEFACTKHELVGHGRRPRFVRARIYAIRRMSAELGMSTTMIGRHMNRDHTTVLYHLLKESLA